ncbi:mevalonate kinase [Fructobacillus sp. M1-13]|uniref:Mevalonate kinase n=1 Tax=Fructobacillus papyriferae TaxID=2713171 RepID=A0ABS5QP26_9LACO|nr:mevalonate kinase [Fructobacillus papyriferae]MBS9334811.1 mevalonate kinase [Fructobacillus papyriferae]MCD2158801.1 mevalonate kinase [Fructobacillus papyriferae]
MKKHAIGTGHAHAKAILIGDHAVVYNQPAVAIPLLDLQVTARFQPLEAGQTIILAGEAMELSDLGADLEGIRQLIVALLKDYQLTSTGFLLEVESIIPQERGFGASAALATAITRAFFDWQGKKVAKETLQTYTSLAENISHGSPSGIDAATVSSSEPVWFENKQIATFETSLNATLVLADTGVRGQTVRAVNIVKEQLKNHYNESWRAIEHLGELAFAVREALQENDPATLGQLFTSAHHDLQALQVSHPKLDQLVATAIKAGALGAKLTGSGIGGAMLALASNDNEAKRIAEALREAGARDCWIQPL